MRTNIVTKNMKIRGCGQSKDGVKSNPWKKKHKKIRALRQYTNCRTSVRDPVRRTNASAKHMYPKPGRGSLAFEYVAPNNLLPFGIRSERSQKSMPMGCCDTRHPYCFAQRSGL